MSDQHGRTDFDIVFGMLMQLNEEIGNISQRMSSFDQRIASLEISNSTKAVRSKRKLRRRAD